MHLIRLGIVSTFFFGFISSVASNLLQHIPQLSDGLDHKELMKAETKKKQIIQKVLFGTPYAQGYDYSIGWYEWHELGISKYIKLFDRTHTAFGVWGLEQLTKPISNFDVIKKRQDALAKIYQDASLFNQCCSLLDEIKSLEDSFLTYFDEYDTLTRDAHQLYYSYFKSVLNNSKVALDYAYIVDSCHAITNLAGLLCFSGIVNEFFSAEDKGLADRILHGIKNGLGSIFRNHNFSDTRYQELKGNGRFNLNYEPVPYPQPSVMNGIMGRILNTGRWMKHKVQLFGRHNRYLFNNTATTSTLFNGSFGDRWSFFKEQCNWASPIAFLWVLGQVAYQDHRLWLNIKQNYKHLKFLFTTQVDLQHRLCDVAQFVWKVQELQALICSVGAISDHPACMKFANLFNDKGANQPIKKMLRLLNSSTFGQKRKVFFSRGHVLISHKLLTEIKDEFIPMMHAIGIIDGFISIARMYRQYKDDPQQPFCLVDICEMHGPILEIDFGWLPLIPKNHVHNSICLGGDTSQHLLLSGPNGGGKSSVLKMIGGTVVMAQSWGIAPARKCKMSLFTRCYTSLNPQENISKDVSTFMAQKQRLEVLLKAAQDNRRHNQYLFLVDEPYRGTIEAEAEKRAYQFGLAFTEYGNCMLAMASHLQQPIKLQKETGVFLNKHLEISALPDGTFERTFNISDGPARWWFDDIDTRMRFIDWLHAEA